MGAGCLDRAGGIGAGTVITAGQGQCGAMPGKLFSPQQAAQALSGSTVGTQGVLFKKVILPGQQSSGVCWQE